MVLVEKRNIFVIFLFAVIFLVSVLVYKNVSLNRDKVVDNTTESSDIRIRSSQEAVIVVSGFPEVKNFIREMESRNLKYKITAVEETNEWGDISWLVGVNEVYELNSPTFNNYSIDAKTGRVNYSTPKIFDENGKFVCITDVNNRDCYEEASLAK